MTTQTIHPRPRMSVKSAALALAGVGLAVGAAFGVSAVLSEDGVPAAPTQSLPDVVNTDGARDSWEGRIGPDARRSGASDNEHPGGLTREKLRQLQ